MSTEKIVWILLVFVSFNCQLNIYAQNPETGVDYQSMTLEQMRDLTYDDFLQIPFEELIGLVKRFKVSSVDELYELILNPTQTTASKYKEDLFDAPLTTTVITATELDNSGARNIPEALRLAPGIIVREKTNGNYDVHIRGNDYVPPGYNLSKSVNSTTLVMIDNRPVYNKYIGTTFWESLPVSIHDLEKIEIIYGPATALYGPNAVSGVIHLITKTPNQEGWNSHVNVQGGNNGSQLGFANVMYSKDKISFSVSGNYQTLNRFSDKYYIPQLNQYLPIKKVKELNEDQNRFFNADEFLDDADRGVERRGFNYGLSYRPNDKTSLSYSGSYQQSWAQSSYFDFGSVLSTRVSKTFSNNVKLKSGKFEAQISNLNGHLNAIKGLYGYEYDISEINGQFGFNFKYKNLHIRPGIETEYAHYSDEDYIDKNVKNGLLNGSVDFGTIQGSLRLDYRYKEKLRLTGALLQGYFTTSKDFFTSYQFSSSYKFNESTLLRAVASKANSSPTVVDAFMNRSVSFEDEEDPDYIYKFVDSGNKELKPLQMNMLELGFRKKIGKKFMADVSLFYNRTKNFNLLKADKLDEGDGETAVLTYYSKAKNINLTSKQYGMTAHVKYVFSEKLSASLFATYQHTKLYDYLVEDENSYKALIGKEPNEEEMMNPPSVDFTHRYTPKFYGGAIINYQPNNKWNINSSIYVYSKQSSFYNAVEDLRLVEIDPKVNCNLKASYQVNGWLNTYVNLRNFTNAKSTEFMFADQTKASYLLGCKLTF
ncbi:MAG: TonB-dependent receptor plug domain-containing protein [Carboxylicivirga sp.]|jgi:iron complex outermembrane receptor protein|nr:TonB-dependent receptor plug domain-containing protein [Carboxylicivirga sp.]